MTLRRRISAGMAEPLVKRFRRHHCRGTAFSLSLPAWRLVPAAAKSWLSYRVLSEVEISARETIRSHDALGTLEIDENNRWALTPSSLLYLWNLVHTIQPRRIVEFGSGLSTQLFAAYAREMKASGRRVPILSIEHDEFWLNQLRGTLSKEGLLDEVELCHAPLAKQHLLGRELEAYSVDGEVFSRSAGGEGFDLCLIDGPPGTVGRAGCLPLVSAYLAPEATILLDDALRRGEQDICREWKTKFKGKYFAPRLQLLDRHGMIRATWRGGQLSSQREQTETFRPVNGLPTAKLS